MKELTRLKLARLKAGYSQKDLADRVGVTPGSVSQWEVGRTFPSVKKLVKLADILNITVEEVINGNEKVG